MKHMHVFCVLALLVAVAVVPSALAQVTYTDSDNPAGPLQMSAWVVGLATAGVGAGIGLWTIGRRH